MDSDNVYTVVEDLCVEDFKSLSHSCFLQYKSYKNRPKNSRVVVKNKVARFFLRHSVYQTLTALHSVIFSIWTHQ